MAHGPNIELEPGRPTGGGRLVQDYLAGAGGAAPFYTAGPFDRLESFAAKAAEIDARFDRAARERAAEALIVPAGGDPGAVERFVERGGLMVTTGQQPALLGGPLYSIHKALTAARLAETLERRLERPVLPVFWVASEDHDWEEANHVHVVGIDNELHRVALEAPEADVRPALHRILLDERVEAATAEFCQNLPDTEFSARYLDLLRGAFRAGSTIPEGFHATLQELLGRFGLFFTDAAHPALKRHSADLLADELTRAGALEETLRATAGDLEAAGYALQVPVLEGAVNVFLEAPGGRERLFRRDDGFRLRASGAEVTLDAVLAAQREDPCALSPNVLLRPVVESAVFPTLAYVGGPGEMAYFGQLGGYFRAHGIEMPVVYPRWSVTPVEGKIRKVLDKFGVAVPDLDRPFHEIAGEVAREEVPGDVRAVLGKLRGAIGAGVGELQASTKGIDPTLKGPVQHMRSQAFAAIDDVERKIVSAVKRETDIALAQLEKAQVHLFPLGRPAERVQSPFYFLARYGDGVLDALHDRFAVNLDPP